MPVLLVDNRKLSVCAVFSKYDKNNISNVGFVRYRSMMMSIDFVFGQFVVRCLLYRFLWTVRRPMLAVILGQFVVRWKSNLHKPLQVRLLFGLSQLIPIGRCTSSSVGLPISSQVCLQVILRKFVCGSSMQICLRLFYTSSSALVRTESASLQVRLYVSRPGRNHQIVDRVLYVGGLTRESL